MVSYLSWAANAVLFVAACFLAANTANTIFAAVLAPTNMEAVASAPPESARVPSWPDRRVILERNLFNSSTVATSGEAELIEEEEIEATTLPLQLLGTVGAENPELAWAAILDKESRKTLVVTIGDLLKEKATVMRIERRRIVLLENDVHRELTIGDDPAPTLSPAALRASRRARTRSPRSRSRTSRRDSSESTVRQLAENRFAMPREDVERALKNPADILSQARFLPKYDGGEMVGFQINSIKSGSVLAGFGIENGDLITEFNGISITSPTESAKLLQEFNNSSSVTLVVEDADGDVRTINVELDD